MGGCNLLALAIRLQLAQDRPRAMRIGGHQMHSRDRFPVDPAQRFPIDRERIGPRHAGRAQPLAQRRFKSLDVERLKDAMQGGDARPAPRRDAQRFQQRGRILPAVLGPLGNRIQAPRAA